MGRFFYSRFPSADGEKPWIMRLPFPPLWTLIVRTWLWTTEVSIVPASPNGGKFISEHGRSGHTNILLGIRLSHLYLPVLTESANTLPRKEGTLEFEHPFMLYTNVNL